MGVKGGREEGERAGRAGRGAGEQARRLAWLRLASLWLALSFSKSRRSGRKALIRALKAMPFCQDVWKLVISTVPLEPSLTCAQNAAKSAATAGAKRPAPQPPPPGP